VGAAEVADAPAALRGADLGVIAADGAVVEDHLEGLEATDTEQFAGFPGSALERAVHSTQADGPLHLTSLAGALRVGALTAGRRSPTRQRGKVAPRRHVGLRRPRAVGGEGHGVRREV